MANYAPSGSGSEWSKWVVYTLAKPWGFTSAATAACVGTLIWAIAWGMLPKAHTLFLEIPLISEQLPSIGVTPERLYYGNIVVIIIASILGLGCWCRVAVICMPKKFDRNKIKGIPI